MTAKRQVRSATALDKIFQDNEHDLIRAAKLQTNYDELYEDVDLQKRYLAAIRDRYTVTPMHDLQRQFRDTFIQSMRNKELAEQLAQFNVFVRAPTDEAGVGESLASNIEAVAEYVPFGSQAVKPITTIINKVGEKLGDKNAALREEQKAAATAGVGGSAKPPYEAILRLCGAALAKSCEGMLLLMDQPDKDFNPIMEYLVNDRMKHALQKNIWTLQTDAKASPVVNLARNIFFSVHIPEKTGGVRVGMKNLFGARYKGPTVKMCGYDIQLEKYLRRQFVQFEGGLYAPLKKKEARDKVVDKNAMFKSIGAELLLIQLAEGGRVIQSKEEKAALDAAFKHAKRGFEKVDPAEIKNWLIKQDALIKNLSGKKPSAVSARMRLIDDKVQQIREQMEKRQAEAVKKVAEEQLAKQQSKLYDTALGIEILAEKLDAMLLGLKIKSTEPIDHIFAMHNVLDLKKLSNLPSATLLANATDIIKEYKGTPATTEEEVEQRKNNLAVLQQALLFMMLDSLPVYFSVQRTEQGELLWQPKAYTGELSSADQLAQTKQALQLLEISGDGKKAWIEFAVVELQARIERAIGDAEEKIRQGRNAAVELQASDNLVVKSGLADFNETVSQYREHLLILQSELRSVTTQEFNLDDNLQRLKNLRSQVNSDEAALSSGILNGNLAAAKNAVAIAAQPDESTAPTPAFEKPSAKLNVFQRLWQWVKSIFSSPAADTKQHAAKVDAPAAATVTRDTAAAGMTTTATLVKMGVAAKAAVAVKATANPAAPPTQPDKSIQQEKDLTAALPRNPEHKNVKESSQRFRIR